jgi:hypothetical protein
LSSISFDKNNDNYFNRRPRALAEIRAQYTCSIEFSHELHINFIEMTDNFLNMATCLRLLWRQNNTKAAPFSIQPTSSRRTGYSFVKLDVTLLLW